MSARSKDFDISNLFKQGLDKHNAGNLTAAKKIYYEILAIQPDHCEANHNLGIVFVANNKLDKGLKFFRLALNSSPNVSLFWASYIDTLVKLKRIIKAKALIKVARSSGISCENIEAISHRLDIENQEPLVKDTCEIDDFMTQKKFDHAIKACLSLFETYPSSAVLNFNLGKCYFELGQMDLAISSYTKATEYWPQSEVSFIMLSQTYSSRGDTEQAIKYLKKALELKPNDHELNSLLGMELIQNGDFDAAIESFEQVLKIKPDYAKAYNGMGTVLMCKGDLDAAIKSYKQALKIKPDYANAYLNIGNALKQQDKLAEAIEAFNKALLLKPDCAEAYQNMSAALQEQDKLEEAIEAYNKALDIKPDNANARARKLHVLANMCDWNSIQEDRKLIPDLGTNEKFVPPFAMLSLEDAPERHRIRSEVYAKVKFQQKPLSLPAVPSKKPKRIRIGYFSTDFTEHPVAYLIAKVLEQHNRDEFEVFGYSTHGNKQSKMQQRLAKSFDCFLDLQGMSDKDAALGARKDKIDIAIDLNGYTENARTGIFAYRAAPIQVNYLGYPGTMGCDFIDYIVADPIVVPVSQRGAYSEGIIYLPHTYQPNDNTRAISEKVTTKAEMGLPKDGFVFCCFNKSYKISPAEFNIWMRLLSKVDGSVLWLLKSNRWAEQNLQKEAEKRGVKKDRLVFAKMLPQDEHLARHKHADIFIDTFNYNAHTTGSDALWAGLPVVTKMGLGFAAQVAGSLLNAVGLPELITKNEQDYEALILELATNSNRLATIKEKLAANRLIQPLFDTEQYTKHLEDGYQQAYQNYFEGKTPQTIIVSK